ncbi:hypothetical protein PGTUg99_015336 [Puccinia graminis f. sp. tritici]|uniref:Uncharacterized protein n=1 Tax=Puccinia graminis f. sp. tritici TaxID=56615 RepID=A0A5B0S3Y5_PUCGR|nr:hypothetical protein PGTUg99_015336 [Puccinia graminis f. sp. tritici]
MGVPLSDVCFRKHQRIAELNGLLRTRTPGTSDPAPQALETEMPSTVSINSPPHALTQNKPPIGEDTNVAAFSHTTSESTTAGPSRGLDPTKRNPREVQNGDLNSEFRFLDQHVLHVLLQASRLHFEDYMSEAACERFLADEKQKLTQLGNRFGFQTSIMVKNIPAS